MNSTAVPAQLAVSAPPAAVRATAVTLRDIAKYFPVRRGWLETIRHPFAIERRPALDGVSCEIAEGEFFGLLGPNGAGKTTLFKLLATLVIPDAGTASVAGHDVVHEAALVRRTLAPVIADERSLYWRISARRNLELYGALQGLTRSEQRERSTELLAVVGLDDAGEKMVGMFSSGMKQRLLIARALIGRPRVLLLDEPTRSLDPISARAFRRFLREEISLRQGCTVILATHNAEEALELCDRVAILDHGRLLAVGRAEQLARELAEDRYRLWTRAPSHPALAALAAENVVRHLEQLEGVDEEGWSRVDMEISGGNDRAARVVAGLSARGMSIARFERLPLSLADLIQRVVEARGAGVARA